MESLNKEAAAFRRCARDLAALSALPAIWFNAGFYQGLQNLADVLAAALRASFVYVRVNLPEGAIAEVSAVHSLGASKRDAAAMGRELAAVVDCKNFTYQPFITSVAGKGPYRLGVSQIAAQGELRGIIVAGSPLEEFPDVCDKLLLNTGAAQIAILVQRLDTELEVKRRSLQLDESNRQLREAHARLVDTKKRLDATLTAGEIGTWTWDLLTNTVIADQNLARLFGLTPAEAAGAQIESYLELVHAEDRAGVKSQIEAALATAGSYSAEYRVVSDAGVRWLFARGRVEKDADGRPIGLPGVVLDITTRKAAENHLRIARDSAESANRAKDKFLAVLSHELRTPLSPILMTVTAWEEDLDLSESLRSDFAMIRRNVELETQLIDDLLDVSRVTSGKLRLKLRATPLHEVLEHAFETCSEDIAGKSHYFEKSYEATNDLVIGDPTRLQQVFWNLLRNAAKFTPNGGRIFVQTFNPSAGRISVEVRDTGVGIPNDSLQRVFSPFEQGETNVTRQFGGLGLGLAICKAVVDMHGGAIRVSSEGAGMGASFVVELATSAPVLNVPASTAPVALSAKASVRNHVLLVEDHVDTAKSLAWLLTRWGYQVTTAHTAGSALEAAEQEHFNVLVSDIGLPDMSGYELMSRLRGRPGLTGIALSGFGMEEDIARALEAGFAEHLVKPVNLAQLKATLQRLLSGEPGSGGDLASGRMKISQLPANEPAPAASG